MMFVIFIEGFDNDGDTAVLKEEDWAEILVSFILFWHIIPVKLRHNGSSWNGIVERWYDIGILPMFEQMSRKGLVVVSLATEMVVVSFGQFGHCAHFGGEWDFLAPHRFLDVRAVGSALRVLPVHLRKNLHNRSFICSRGYGVDFWALLVFTSPVISVYLLRFKGTSRNEFRTDSRKLSIRDGYLSRFGVKCRSRWGRFS